MFVYPHIFVHPHTFVCPRVYIPQYVPHTPLHLSVLRGSQRLLHVVGGCKGLPYVLRHLPCSTPVSGCLHFSWTPTPLSCWLPSALVCSKISVCHVSIFPFYWEFGGVPPSVGGSWGTSAPVLSICSFLYIL